MFDSRSPKRRGGRRRAPQQSEKDEWDKDYGFGYSAEGRPITGIIDESVHDPQAEIFEDKGETQYINLAERKAVKMCAPNTHNLVPDETETEFEAVTCTRCPFGQLLHRK